MKSQLEQKVDRLQRIKEALSGFLIMVANLVFMAGLILLLLKVISKLIFLGSLVLTGLLVWLGYEFGITGLDKDSVGIRCQCGYLNEKEAFFCENCLRDLKTNCIKCGSIIDKRKSEKTCQACQ